MIARRPGADLRKPPIVLSSEDRRRLEAIALNALLENPRAAGPLLEEVDRAAVGSRETPAVDAVGLGSRVEFLDALTGETKTVRLVETPGREGELGVLHPLGVALVGLSAGQSILARDHRGSEHLLTVLGVAES